MASMVEQIQRCRRLEGSPREHARLRRRLARRAEQRWLEECWQQVGRDVLEQLANSVQSGDRTFHEALQALAAEARMGPAGGNARHAEEAANSEESRDSI